MIKEILKQDNKEFKKDYYNIVDDLKKGEINLRVGGRGLGKSFSTYKFLFDDFLENNKKFVIIRRQQTDINSLLTDILCYYDIKLTYEVHEKSSITDIYINDKLCGYLISLSCNVKYKSHTFLCDNILYDEFIRNPTERRICKNEYIAFFELLETIIRDRQHVTVIMLSNAVTSYNDYFLSWKILVGDLTENKIHYVNNVTNIIMLPSTNEYKERKKKTLTYQASENTDYQDYAYNNIFSTGFLKAYVKKNNSKVLPSSKDFFFKFGVKYYCINDKFIYEVTPLNIPKKSKIYYRGLSNLIGEKFINDENLYIFLSETYTNKILNRQLFFDSIDTAVLLQDIFFMKIETGGIF